MKKIRKTIILFNKIRKFAVLSLLILSSTHSLNAADNSGDDEAFVVRRIAPSGYRKSDEDMLVSFIDVGQGNSVLIESPTGETLLYDAGGTPSWMDTSWDPGMELVVPYLKERGIQKLDYLVISHAHGDHIGGMEAIVYNFEIGTLVDPGFEYSSPIYESLLETIKSREIDYRIVKEADEEKIDLGPEVEVDVFNPPADYYYRGTNSDLNNNSIVMKVVYNDVSFLLTGDVEERGEGHLVKSYRSSLESNILQVAHHGSDTSSTIPFLEQVVPEAAVIPVGERNMYGHPRAETLDNLERAGAEVYRTDMDGNIRIYTNGKAFTIETGN